MGLNKEMIGNSVIVHTHMESSIHGLSEPDVFAVLALAGPPVLLWYLGDAWVNTGLSSLHVTEGLDSISCAANVGINPVVTYIEERSLLNCSYLKNKLDMHLSLNCTRVHMNNI